MATKYCGNCPGRFETAKTSRCRIYGELPWGEELDQSTPLAVLVDMLRPAECATKPRNRYEVCKRRDRLKPTTNHDAQGAGEG